MQIPPESLHNAARIAAGLLYDERDHEACVAGDACHCHGADEVYGDLLAAELLRGLPPTAPAFVAEITHNLVCNWVHDHMVMDGASLTDYLESAHELFAAHRQADSDLNDPVTREILTRFWDGCPPNAIDPDPSSEGSSPWEAVRTRVNEQLDAVTPALLARVELFAQLFALRTEPHEQVAPEVIYELLRQNYGLERPAAEPRARARP